MPERPWRRTTPDASNAGLPRRESGAPERWQVAGVVRVRGLKVALGATCPHVNACVLVRFNQFLTI